MIPTPSLCETSHVKFSFDGLYPSYDCVSHHNSINPELLAILIGCDVPLHVQQHLAALGIISVAKLAFCVSTDKELIEEILGSMGDLLR